MATAHLLNMEQLLAEMEKPPIFVNDFDTDTEDDKERFDSMLLSVYDTNELRAAPQCSCGELKGMFRLGDRCGTCGDVVTETFDTTIESNLWMMPLPGVDTFITPISWTNMSTKMKLKDGFDTLKWLCDPYYRAPKGKVYDRADWLLKQGHERGINYFYQNFDKVMEDFIYYNGKTKVPDKLNELAAYIDYNRDKIFTSYLPVPNRVMFPIERSGNSSYGDKSMIDIINAVRVIQEGESRKDSLSLKQKQHRVVKAIELFAKFHFEYVKSTLGGKPGSMRQHLLGGRWHFTSRAVIGSIFKPHNFLELHWPWAVAMEQLKMHVVNKLIKRGHTLYEINDMLRKYAVTYNKYIADIFQELIDESPYLGIPVIFQRNPTIRRASAIMVYITKIKEDSDDHTISASVGNLTGMNADFDGDALNTVIVLDKETHDRFLTLSPLYNVMDLSKPWAISDNLKMQAPVVSTAANWLLKGRKAAYGDKE